MKTTSDFISDYLGHLRSIFYSPATIRGNKSYLLRFDQYLRENLGLSTIAGLRREHLKNWHCRFIDLRTPKGYPLKATSINRHNAAIRSFLKYLADHNIINRGLADYLPAVKEPHCLPGSVLDHGQVKKLLAKIPTDTSEGYRNRAMLEMLYTSGIRAGELLGLDVKDIDFKTRTALVTGKGNKERIVPIGKEALRHLETYVVAVRSYLLKHRPETALFVSRRGKRLSYQTFCRIVSESGKKAGLEEAITAHTFRRSCATELIRSGANIYHVKELLGHESLDTMKHYAKLTIVDLKKTHKKCHPREKDSG